MKKAFMLLFAVLALPLASDAQDDSGWTLKSWTVSDMEEWLLEEFGIVCDDWGINCYFGNPQSSNPDYTWLICVPPPNVLSIDDLWFGGKNPLGKRPEHIAWPDGDKKIIDDYVLPLGRDGADSSYSIFVRPSLNPDRNMIGASDVSDAFRTFEKKREMVITLREAFILSRFLKNKFGISSDDEWDFLGSTLTCSRNWYIHVEYGKYRDLFMHLNQPFNKHISVGGAYGNYDDLDDGIY